MAQKISYWLLISLVLSLGFGQLLRFDISGVSLYLHDVLVVCILVLQGLTSKERSNLQIQRREGQTLMHFGLKAFLFAMAIGWLHALMIYPVADLLVPALYSVRLLSYLALYLVIKNQKLLILDSVFLLSGIFTLSIGYLQYYLSPDMRIFQYLGWDDHLNRLTLPHFDPTFTAVMLSFFTLQLYQHKRNLLAMITVPALFLTYSRSIWLSLVVVGTVSAIQHKKYAKLFMALAILVVVIMVQPKKFGEGTNLLRLFSIESRIAHDLSYIKKYRWELLLGRGMNTLILDSSSAKYSNHATGPNNSYLYLLATTGVVGLVGWGVFMQSLYMKSHYKPLIQVFFIASLFNNVMFYPFALLWILLLESK